MPDTGESTSGGATGEALRQAHEESLDAARELAEQVEAAEAAEGEPAPSQADADESVASGI